MKRLRILAIILLNHSTEGENPIYKIKVKNETLQQTQRKFRDI